MGFVRRHRWFVAAAGITLAFAGVSLSSHRGPALNTIGDLVGLILMLAALASSISNAAHCPKQERSFWILLALGFTLWIANQAAWTMMETVLHRQIPDPFVFDIVLFFHAVPMIAAVAWRPDVAQKEGGVALHLLNFLTLCGWWVFLYAFIVFPYQYVTPDVAKYNQYYDLLYAVENGLLIGVLVVASITSSGGWRRLYLHILAVSVLYGINSQLLDRAAADSSYYSGSIYDVPLIATVAWIAAASLSSRKWDLQTVTFSFPPRWRGFVPQVAMLAILSLPVLGLWAALLDDSPSRHFRLFAVLAAMLVLGTFVFLRQYLQDQALMSLLKESRQAYEGQKQLQNQLVQKEKLASLGQLIAGAAHEIDHPLTAVMTYSEQLWSKEKLTPDQDAMVRKIVNQARRTRDLVASLLSFAQQAPGDKTRVELDVLLSRAKQMLEARRQGGKIQARLSISAGFPPVHGNANQLFQACIEIIENAMDALDESGGGVLDISAERQNDEVVLQFSDTGPGIRDPQRVFDPFYTTKPVGKGTGLGLSAVYGIIQDHGGQISCRNKPEGGALFTVRLPAATQAAGAAAV